MFTLPIIVYMLKSLQLARICFVFCLFFEFCLCLFLFSVELPTNIFYDNQLFCIINVITSSVKFVVELILFTSIMKYICIGLYLKKSKIIVLSNLSLWNCDWLEQPLHDLLSKIY